MKYLVMECQLSYAVVLDEDGRFLKVANRQYEVGQTVTDVIEMQVPPSASQKNKRRRWAYTWAAMAACLVLIVTSVLHLGQLPYASVYMTINPEVRIDVNRHDVVVAVDGINMDGIALVAEYDYQKKTLDLVMAELVDLAIDMGYLHEGGQISLVLDADNDEWVISHNDALTAVLTEHLQEEISVTIEVTDQKAQRNQVVIPISPTETNYSASDYGQTGQPTTPPAPSSPASGNPSGNQYGDGSSDYAASDLPVVDDSDYETDNGASAYEAAAQSDYDDGQSSDPEAQSDYADSTGQSGYDSDDAADSSSSEHTGGSSQNPSSVPDSDYGASGYLDDAQSDYEADDDSAYDSTSNYDDGDDDD